MLYGKRTDKDESVKNTIIATGDAVGKTTITAKTTSGKKATVSVTVAATPDNVTIYAFDGSEDKGYSTYSGKKTTMKAVLTAKDKPLPVGTTKLKWSIEKVDNKADKNAKVSGKKDIATITPANLLTDPDNGVTVKVKVVATWKDNGSTETKEDTYTLALKQSDVSDIEILSKDITGDAEKAIVGKLPTKKNAKAGNIYIGNDYNCNVNAYNSAKALDNALAETIGWTVSGKSAEINENGILKPIKAGKTTVTASYVTLDKSKAKTKAKLNKKTFTVSVIQNASEIALNKTEFVVSGLKATGKKNITISAKAVAPNKKATFTIPNDGWKILAADKDGKDISGSITLKKSAKKVVVTVPGSVPAGSTIKVGAYTDTGAVAYAYIYVTNKTSKVQPKISVEGAAATEPNKKGEEITLGKTATITTMIDGHSNAYVNKKGTTYFYEYEPVTYTVDKKGSSVVKVDADGTVRTLKKGKATITVKTISGKKATVKIIVK